MGKASFFPDIVEVILQYISFVPSDQGGHEGVIEILICRKGRHLLGKFSFKTPHFPVFNVILSKRALSHAPFIIPSISDIRPAKHGQPPRNTFWCLTGLYCISSFPDTQFPAGAWFSSRLESLPHHPSYGRLKYPWHHDNGVYLDHWQRLAFFGSCRSCHQPDADERICKDPELTPFGFTAT